MSEVVNDTEARNSRKLRRGVVYSNKMDKTVVVTIDRAFQHPLYGKTVRRTKHVKAHDELNCDIGDTVEIMETRPLSKTKHWRVTRIIEKVK
ncbi:MAG: 30S ribosomal protein S17 [Fimbriimonadaceae bacterium]|nr:30S ribosomal protein S17 [Fimbriimonadaceae bacterium]